MSLVEIDVRVNDDTGAGWAAVAAKYNAFKSSLGPIPVNLDLDTDAAVAKLAALRTAAGNVHMGVDASGGGLSGLADILTRIDTSSRASATALQAVSAALADTSAKSKDAGNSSATAATMLGFLGATAGRATNWFRGMNQSVSLWGGAFKGILPTWIAGASYLHLLADAAVEFLAVVIPATIGLIAFGAAAAPTVGDIKTQLTNLQTVSEATGRAMYPLTGAFSKAADAAKPYVYQLFGDALTIASQKSGAFTTVVSGVGSALADLGSRFVVAIDSSNSLGAITQNAAHDVALLGSVVGNIGGIFGTVFKAVPGYAQVLLSMANSATSVAEHIVSAGEPVLHFGLIAHGAFVYAGLAATGFANIIPKVLTGIGNFAANLGSTEGRLASFGTLGERAATGLRGFGVAAAGASALPWGWIAVAAAGIGVIAYALLSAKDATQQWTASLQQALQQANAVKGLTMLMSDQAAVASRLAQAQAMAATESSKYSSTLRAASGSWRTAGKDINQGATDVNTLTGAFNKQQQELTSYREKMSALAGQYHGMGVAQGLVAASGISMNMMMARGAQNMAQVRAQVAATAHAYTAMGQTGGILGADMQVLNRLASDQTIQMQKLDQNWSTFISRATGVESALVGIIGSMRTVDKESEKAKASFTGVNNASLTLRGNMATLVNSTQTMVQNMRDAHAPASAMAAVIGTVLKGAVNAGALENQVFYQSVSAMARQAGYTGTSISALRGFIDGNATSTSKLSQITDQYGQNLGKLPTSKHTTVTNTANTAAGQAQNYINVLNSIPRSIFTTVTTNNVNIGMRRATGGISSAAMGGGRGGMTLVGEEGPELVRLPQGSNVYSNPDTQNMLGPNGYAGSSGSGVAQFEVVPGGSGLFERFMSEFMKKYIRLRGGSVQSAFGGRT